MSNNQFIYSITISLVILEDNSEKLRITYYRMRYNFILLLSEQFRIIYYRMRYNFILLIQKKNKIKLSLSKYKCINLYRNGFTGINSRLKGHWSWEIGHRAREDVPEKQGSNSLSLAVQGFREKIESICSSQNKKRKIIMILKSHNYLFMEA